LTFKPLSFPSSKEIHFKVMCENNIYGKPSTVLRATNSKL